MIGSVMRTSTWNTVPVWSMGSQLMSERAITSQVRMRMKVEVNCAT